MSENKVRWKSPSNIALVKYWGKKGFQLPANASISFTLSECFTDTTLSWNETGSFDVEVELDGEKSEAFKPKVEKFFKNITERYPILSRFTFSLQTSNTFPHSSGIASSASGMSALALCVCSFLDQNELLKQEFYREASYLARIGSGSACRSVYGLLAEWGKHPDYTNSTDEAAIPHVDVHPVFNTYQDTILLVHEGQKSVSSTAGHALLNNHPFEDQRYQVAGSNMTRIKEILATGDLDEFCELIEYEALMLHSLIMTSNPSYILMEPNTLAIIQKIRDYRKQNDCHIAFTLDAGANVHMLYPERDIDKAKALIDTELKQYCSNGRYICDKVGQGPEKLKC